MRIILIILLFSVGFQGFSQEKEVAVLATVKDDDTGKKLSGAIFEVYSEGKLVKTEISPANGKLPTIYLETNKKYRVFVKKPGYVTKMAEIDTKVEYPEDADNLAIIFVVSIFERVEGVDFSYLESTPMTKLYFDDEYIQAYDKKYTEGMLDKIEELKRQIQEKKDELEKKEEEAKEIEADFQAYVDAGDAAMAVKDYARAVTQYELALGLRKDDISVQTKLKEAKRLLAEQEKNAANEQAYIAKMTEALVAYKAEDWQNALALYTVASDLKKSAQEPKDKIAEIKLKLEEEKALLIKIDALEKTGDDAVTAEQFDDAISKYTEALGLKQMDKIQEKLEKAKELKAAKEAADKEAAKINEQFAALMKSADKLFNDEKYEDALAKYQEAKLLKSEELIPPQQIKVIEEILKNQEANAQLTADYNAKMEEAQTAFDAEKWEDALVLYQAAEKLKDNEPKPKDRIIELNGIIAKEKQRLEAYQKLVDEGDQLVGTKAYKDAISKYEEARAIKDTPEVEEKIRAALQAIEEENAALAAKNEEESKYQNAIAEADKNRDLEKYEASIQYYGEALDIKKDDPYAKSEIEKIKKIIAELEAAEAERQKTEAAYLALISEADDLFNNEKYPEAKVKYQQALSQRSDDPHPSAQIELIDKKLAELAAIEANNKAYNEAMTEGDKLKGEDKLKEAIESFKSAQKLKPEESLPQQKIDEINQILSERSNDEEREKSYARLIEEANGLRDAKEWLGAKGKYSEALSYKTDDSYALAEIEKIDKILADERLAEENNARFLELVAEGDGQFDQKDFSIAISTYKQALDIKDDEGVKAKIKACEAGLIGLENIAEQQAQYEAQLKAADEIYQNEDWEKALEAYKAIQATKPTNEVADRINSIEERLQDVAQEKEQIEQVKSLVTEGKGYEAANDYKKALNTYEAAYALRPDPETEQFIQIVRAKLEDIQAQENVASYYQSKIEEADALFNNENWQEAISIYKAAKAIKGDEVYPDKQIEISKGNIARAAESEQRIRYDNMITEAQNAMAAKRYDEAIIKFQQAKAILPGETYPDLKIKDIKAIQAELANKNAKELEEDRKFQNLVSSADNAFNSQNFDAALSDYNKALLLRPTDSYVETKVKETKVKIEALNKAKLETAKFNEYVARGDEFMKAERWDEAINEYKTALIYDPENAYPKKQIDLANQSKANEGNELSEGAYEELLNNAKQKFDNESYKEALALYKEAFSQKPSDDVPYNKISEINQILDNLNKTERTKNRYDNLIAKADNLFEKKEWEKAKVLYIEAYNLSNDSYPDSQIKKIEAIHKPFLDAQYDRMIAKADEYFKDKNYLKARELYRRALKTFTTKNSAYPKSQIKKINSILNPPQLTKSGGRTPVGTKVTLSEEEIQKLFAEGEDQREGMEISKVLDLENSTGEYEAGWLKVEENEIYIANAASQSLASKVFEQDMVASIKASELTELVDNTYVVYNAKMKEESVYSENVIYRQNQVVNNIDRELTESKFGADQERQNVEDAVVRIDETMGAHSAMKTDAQGNMIFKQVDHINKIDSEQFSSLENSEVGRLNSELDANNILVDIVNAQNNNVWSADDNMHSTQNILKAIEVQNYESSKYSDVPRQNMEEQVTEIEESQTLVTMENEAVIDDIMHKSTSAINDLETTIQLSNKDANESTLKMEEHRLIVESAINDANTNLVLDNEEQMHITTVIVEGREKEQFESKEDKVDQKFKDNDAITEIVDQVGIKKVNDDQKNNLEMHMTEDYTESAKKNISNNGVEADLQAEDNSDAILNKVEQLTNSQVEAQNENKKDLNKMEDLMNLLDEIDVDQIDQHVKNELGTKFPEGVTQEVYKRNDDDGIVLSYIVRRVVVIEGEGNVYEKTQTKFGISYTKNGQPITDYTWENETEDANLTFH